jgi:hypothetical protein
VKCKNCGGMLTILNHYVTAAMLIPAKEKELNSTAIKYFFDITDKK